MTNCVEGCNEEEEKVVGDSLQGSFNAETEDRRQKLFRQSVGADVGLELYGNSTFQFEMGKGR